MAKVVTAQDVRDWAADKTINGLVGVAVRGRLPFEVIEAYNKCHRVHYSPLAQQPLPVLTIKGKRDAKGRINASAAYKVTNPDVRQWAIAQGFTVGVRGRLPKAVLDAYRDAMNEATAS